MQVNQWKNSQAVVRIVLKNSKQNNPSFTVFNIATLYPSISPELFHKAINFAKTIGDVPDKDISIIMQSRRTLLFNNKEPWLKKSGNEEFDVPLGYFDGAEDYELVGVYILHLLTTVMRKEDVGLYRDDGLGILRNSSGPEIERKRKQIIQIFKSCGLNITVKTNFHSIIFLLGKVYEVYVHLMIAKSMKLRVVYLNCLVV